MNEAEQLQSTATNITKKVVTEVAQSVKNAAIDIFQKETRANVKAWTDVCNQIIDERKKIRESTKELLVKGEEVSKRFKELFPDVTDAELEKATGRSNDQLFADFQKSIAVTPEEQEKTKQEIKQAYQKARAKYLLENGISNEFDDLPPDVRSEKLLLQNMKPLQAHQFDAEILELAAAMNNFVSVKMQRYDAEIQRKRELEAQERLRKAAAKCRKRRHANHFWTTVFNIAKVAVVGAVAWIVPPLAPTIVEAIVGSAAAVGAADAAMQGLGLALKVQDKFSPNEVLESSIMGGIAPATQGLNIVERTGAVAASTTATEAIEVGLGMKEKIEISNIAFQTAASVVASALNEIIPELIPEKAGPEGSHIAATVADTTVSSVLNHAITGAPIDIGHIATNIAGKIAGKKLGETAISAETKNMISEPKQFLSSADIVKGLSTTCFLNEGDETPSITTNLPNKTEKTVSLSGFETLDKVTNAMTHPKPLFPSEWKVGARVMGGLQAVGGAAEAGLGAGLALATAESVAGILFFGTVATSGIDNVVTGTKTAITGNDQKTNFVKAVENLGGNPKLATLSQAALDLASPLIGASVLRLPIGTLFRRSATGRESVGSQLKYLLESPRENLLRSIENPKLKNITARMYRENAEVASGSTADAIRLEIKTGELLSASGHTQKGIEMRTALTKLIESGNLNQNDAKIARWLRQDLQEALSEKQIHTKTMKSGY